VSTDYAAPEIPPSTLALPISEANSNTVLNVFSDSSLIGVLRQAPYLILLLDYDGTLVPYSALPENAAPEFALVELLMALTRRPKTSVNITSGRAKETLERWFAQVLMGLFAEHGLWDRRDPKAAWRPLHPISTDWKTCIVPILENFTRQTPGSLMEDKSASIAWHYRLVDPDIARWRVCEVKFCLDEFARDLPIDVLSGDKVIEVRMRGVNKGLVLEAFDEQLADALILALGDDCTDEDLFAVLPRKSISVHVGSKPTRARYRLRDFRQARRLLQMLVPDSTAT
jgi:trehalose 6-phosphate synthase/phosphatase